MSKTIKIAMFAAVWGGLLLASLSISQAPGHWGHGICGPWGCGPPLQALLGCHLAWLVALAPVGILGYRLLSPRQSRMLALAIISSAIIVFAAFIIHQRWAWYPQVSEWHRGFIWQRCLFLIATTVDVPVCQSFLVGLVLLMRPRTSSGPVDSEPATTNAYSEPPHGLEHQAT